MVRKGMAGRYKYRRMQVPGEELYSDKPVKNKFSHPCEATQYLALGAINTDLKPRDETPRPPPNWRA